MIMTREKGRQARSEAFTHKAKHKGRESSSFYCQPTSECCANTSKQIEEDKCCFNDPIVHLRICQVLNLLRRGSLVSVR